MRLFPALMGTLTFTTVFWRASASYLPTSSSSRKAATLAFQGHAISLTGRKSAAPSFVPFVVRAASSSSPLSAVSSSPFSLREFSTDRHHIRKSTSLEASSSSSDTTDGGDATTTSSSSAATNNTNKKPIPTILLAGFLGSGKTTTLKNLLQNNQNIKIGTIVNDVASVNIDAKLIVNTSDGSNNNGNNGKGEFSSSAEAVVELQNGCACCSLADELFTSVVRLTEGGKRELDAIVVELSGVADPVAVRDNWDQAKMMGHPATKIADLRRTVTLIDACTFGTDWMTWDTAGDRDSWTDEGDDCSAVRKVPELLAEQVEAADLLLVNKIDLAGERQVQVASGVARGLNDKATVVEVEFGKVEVKELLGGVLDDSEEEEEEQEKEDGHSHGHSHDHSSPESSDCTDPTSTDSSHSHEHAHDHSCDDPSCTDDSHSHSHSHDHSCDDPTCTDSSHSHSHDHGESCNDPDCTDPSHSHSHDHKSSTATDQLGITSFVYKASTPFNSQRLLALLNRWPVPIKDSLELGLELVADDSVDNKAFAGVLRSKGFCWMAPTKWTGAAGSDVWRHDTAMYWSHAGKHFGITSAGKWWGTLSKEQMKPYFANNMNEYERIMKEDWVSEEWGDRRQELVFIGANLDEAGIRKALDDCLCTDDEMELYRAQLRNYLDTTFSSVRSGPSLFDVGSVDHMDQ